MKNIIKGRIMNFLTLQTVNGKTVINFSIATHKAFRTRTGRKQRTTKIHKVEAWGGIARGIENHLRQGDLVEFDVNVRPNVYVKPQTGEQVEELVSNVLRFELKKPSRRSMQQEQAAA